VVDAFSPELSALRPVGGRGELAAGEIGAGDIGAGCVGAVDAAEIDAADVGSAAFPAGRQARG
jgi:hypothetical protein